MSLAASDLSIVIDVPEVSFEMFCIRYRVDSYARDGRELLASTWKTYRDFSLLNHQLEATCAPLLDLPPRNWFGAVNVEERRMWFECALQTYMENARCMPLYLMNFLGLVGDQTNVGGSSVFSRVGTLQSNGEWEDSCTSPGDSFRKTSFKTPRTSFGSFGGPPSPLREEHRHDQLARVRDFWQKNSRAYHSKDAQQYDSEVDHKSSYYESEPDREDRHWPGSMQSTSSHRSGKCRLLAPLRWLLTL